MSSFNRLNPFASPRTALRAVGPRSAGLPPQPAARAPSEPALVDELEEEAEEEVMDPKKRRGIGRQALINTSSQGVLGNPNTGRRRLTAF